MFWNLIRRAWVYFRRGHFTYLSFFISFANFIVIQHQLLLEKLSIHVPIWIFAILVVATYAPIAVALGWLDYKRVSVPVETELSARVNPWARDVAKALALIAQGRNEEAIEVLRKWMQ